MIFSTNIFWVPLLVPGFGDKSVPVARVGSIFTSIFSGIVFDEIVGVSSTIGKANDAIVEVWGSWVRIPGIVFDEIGIET